MSETDDMHDHAEPVRIVHVDDHPEELTLWKDELERSGEAVAAVRHPQKVTEDDLREADLVLVDVVLESWPERDCLPLGLRPVNGLALLSVLQEHAHSLGTHRPCAFALFTAQIDRVARGLVPSEHMVARLHDLDWVFDKKRVGVPAQARRIIELGRAVQGLPRRWPGEDAEQADAALRTWLALPAEEVWTVRAWEDVIRCYPPAHELAEHTHGVAVLRWMLHRILPYPCFLLDEHHLAARLRVRVDALRAALGDRSALADWLEPARYQGHLAAFLGSRFWRSGIEALIFQRTQEDPTSLDLLHQELRKMAPGIEFETSPTVAVALKGDFQPMDDLVPIERAIHIQPDDWPPYAGEAWTTPELASENASLRAVVLVEDRERLLAPEDKS